MTSPEFETNPAAANPPIAVVILAAGQGSRMKSKTPKVLHKIGGQTMLGHVLAASSALAPQKRIVVFGANGAAVAEAGKQAGDDVVTVRQDPPQGTGDAVAQTLPALEGFSGVVLVLYADTPLVEAQTMAGLAQKAVGCGAAVLGFRPAKPGAYGRLKQDSKGALEAIVEAKDASDDELAITLCNSGVMAIEADFLRRGLPQLNAENAKGEYYLTDLIAIARKEGLSCAIQEASADEVLGVNSRAELSVAEKIFQNRRRADVMSSGVTLIDPETVYFSFDTKIENDVLIEPNVFFGPGVAVAQGAVIKAHCHIEGARIGPEAQVGPFARLRPGTNLEQTAKIGNFVEVKNADIGQDAKVSHLTYIGDASIGAHANIGAGTITCNYDGFSKHKTEIGEGAFIGSNSALVAPVKINDGAYVGSGSVITKDVDKDALAVARGRQSSLKGWAARFRKAKGDE